MKEGVMMMIVMMIVMICGVEGQSSPPSPPNNLHSTNNSPQRFLSLFSVVRFKNVECSGINGHTGVCYTQLDCVNGGGTVAGDCAQGFGVCCVTRIGCGESSPNNCSYVESVNYPKTFNTGNTCTHTLNLAPEICQVRLDVERVELSPPNTFGICNDDTLTFSQDNKWTSVCGTTLDSHFYVDVDPSVTSTLTLTFTTSTMTYDRRWRIKLSQISCDQLSLAPSGCGQYFTAPKGSIKGWNHDGLYLAGQNYAICVRKERDSCSASYLDNQRYIFRPICDDTLELPYPVISGLPQNTLTCNSVITLLDPAPLTIPLQGPHYFYFTTKTDTVNDHSTAQNLNYLYTQNPC